MKSETCSRCGEEVRYGKRGNLRGWLHREDVDHAPILGTIRTPEMMAEDERLRRLHRPEEFAEAVVEPLPEPELRSTPVTVDEFPPRSGIRQIANLIPKQGWEIARFTKARGPYLGAKGESLGTSDSVVLGARGPVQLDGSRRVAVASWRDGSFDSAYTGILEGGRLTTTGVNSAGLKAWIKGTE